MRKNWLCLVVLALSLFVAEMVFFAGDGATAEKNLIFATPVDIMSVDPHQGSGTSQYQGIHPFYDTLVTLKGGTTEIGPALAESWTVSPDGKSITFKLRKNVKFHDGRPLTAEDVKFTFIRHLKAKKASPSMLLNKLTSEEMLEVVDPHTFKMGLRNVSPVVFATLTTSLYGIMSKDYVTKHATNEDPEAFKWMFNHECGSGPWELVQWSPNEKIGYKRFKDYWGDNSVWAPVPKVDSMTILIVKEPSTMVMMLRKGEVDMATGLGADDYESLKADPNIKVTGYPGFMIGFIQINASRKPFDNVKVRQALNCAINYDELIKYIERGNALRIHTMLPDGMWGKNDDVMKYNYDPQRAKELLKEAGYPNGFETTLLYSQERYGPYEQASVYIQAYLNNIGIKTKLTKVAWPIQLETMRASNFDLALQTWSPFYPDPAEFLPYFYNANVFKGRGWNFSFWDNPTTTELCEKAEKVIDGKERETIYRQVQKIGIENAVYVPLYQLKNMLATRSNITGHIWHPSLWHKQFATVDKK
jgi:peptide/nickel transport system substrate-binding protein